MQPEQDWRIDNCKRLRAVALRRKKYSASSKQWDHDHCAHARQFADLDDPEILHEGYRPPQTTSWELIMIGFAPTCFRRIAATL